MIKIDGYLMLLGENFSPSQLERFFEIRFDRKNEKGEIASKGRYIGRAVPHGSAEYHFSVEPKNRDMFSLDDKLVMILDQIDLLKNEYGISEISVYWNVAYRGQCNLEISVGLMNRMARYGIPMLVTCYKDEELE